MFNKKKKKKKRKLVTQPITSCPNVEHDAVWLRFVGSGWGQVVGSGWRSVDVSLVEFMYPVLIACQVGVIIGDSGSLLLCSCSMRDVNRSSAITSRCLLILQELYCCFVVWCGVL